ncbi:MAG: hypothetical protein ACHQNA_04890 [Acidimicrobiales bacterium]
MPSPRLGHDEQVELALDDLVRLGSVLDELSVVITGPQQVSLHHRGGIAWPAKVVAYEAVGEAQARQLVASQARGHKVVVANRISETARQYLSSQGWAWLDRRIGAHIPIGRRDIEVRYRGQPDLGGGRDDTSPVLRSPTLAADGPIRGRAGMAYAAALLCRPGDPPSFRSVAEAVNMSPTAISNAVKHLAVAGLVAPDNTPTVPELFWALAGVWTPLKVIPIASPPHPGNREFNTGRDRLDLPGWVLGADMAAAELGAPIFSVETRPWLWIPTQVELRRAERSYGPSIWSDRAAVIAIPPTPLVCRWRRPPAPDGGAWPLPHPVFAALELARDPGRGRDVLAQWSPEDVDIVWR